MESTTILLIASLVSIGVGLVFCFQGYRVFHFSLATVGFAVGALLAGSSAYLTTNENMLAAVASGFVGGLSTWGIARSFYRSGMFLVGFALSAVVFLYAAITLEAITIDTQNLSVNALQETLPVIMVGLAIAFGVGLLFLIFDKPIVKIATAFIGAALSVIGVWVLLIGRNTTVSDPAELFNGTTMVFAIAWVFLAAAGATIQFGLLPVRALIDWEKSDDVQQRERMRRQYHTQQEQFAQQSQYQAYQQQMQSRQAQQPPPHGQSRQRLSQPRRQRPPNNNPPPRR